MSAAARHLDKTLRLATLRAMGALDTRAEPLFDALVRSAAAASGRALALIVLVDADGPGLAVHAPAPDIDEPSVLRVLAKASSGVLEIPDARVDPRCADDPLVVGAAGIRCLLDVSEHTTRQEVPANVRHNVFLVIKEALQNIVKHAHASEVWLRIAATERELRVAIEDNGCGFDRLPADAWADGLRNMRQRLAEIGGQCAIQSRAGQGTIITFELPWPVH